MSPFPTLIFIHGAWFPSTCWDPVINHLPAYKTISISLPSVATSLPSATFHDDITAVRTAILSETSQGNDVILVVHSYGALPGHSAARGLTLPAEPEKDKGYVLGFAMIATGFTQTGLAFLDGTGGKPPPSWKADTESGFAVLVTDPKELFFHDLAAEEAGKWTGRLGKQSLKALAEGGEHAYAGWIDAPCWVLATTKDRALPVEVQKMLAAMAKQVGAKVTLREVDGGHAAMLSRPKEVAEFLRDAVEDVSRGRS